MKIWMVATGIILLTLGVLGGLGFLIFGDQGSITRTPLPAQSSPLRASAEADRAAETILAVSPDTNTPGIEIAPAEGDADLLRSALRSADRDACGRITSTRMQSECRDSIILAEALESANNGLCQQINDIGEQEYCNDQTILNLAKEYSEYDRCNEIVSERASRECQQLSSESVLSKITNIDECADITNTADRLLCTDFFATQQVRDKTELSASDCSVFGNQGEKEQCLLRAAIDIAIKNRDISACQNLPKKSFQQDCFVELQQSLAAAETEQIVASGDVEACADIADAAYREYCRDQSLFVRAEKTKNPSLCRSIQNNKQKLLCSEKVTTIATTHYYALAKKEGNPKWCDKIPNIETQQYCQESLSNI